MEEFSLAEKSFSTVGQAMQIAPKLTHVFQACHVSGFFELLNKSVQIAKNEDNGYEKAYERALHKVLEENPSILETLPNYALGILIDKIGRYNDSDPVLLEKIFENYQIENSSGYVEFEQEKRSELLRRFAVDPVIKDKMQNWDMLNETDKVDFAKHIHGIHAQIYGFPPAEIKVATIEPVKTISKDPSEMFYTGAQYSPEEGAIHLNNYADGKNNHMAILHTDSVNFIGNLIHEGDHRFQHHLSDRYSLIMSEEDRYLYQHKEVKVYMSPKEEKKFETHMRNWAQKELPGGSADPLNQNLLEKGSLYETALSMQAHYGGVKTYLSVGENHSTEIYMQNPMEKTAYSIQDEVVGFMAASRQERVGHLVSYIREGFRNREGETNIINANAQVKPSDYCTDVKLLVQTP